MYLRIRIRIVSYLVYYVLLEPDRNFVKFYAFKAIDRKDILSLISTLKN